LTFLLAFMFYNDGIQTVINMATIYGKDELGLDTTVLMLTLLVIQLVATAGALLFSRLASWLGTKRTVMLTLLIWSGIVIDAYFIQSALEFFALGVVVGLVLGGSQALSRSLYGSMIPPESSAEFYGFYTLFSKFSSIWGPWVFAVITLIAGSARTAILSLVAFFLVGLVLLALVDEEKARQAGREGEATRN
jgi:UMF1 family MFS transporter